ncbi:MAG: DUF2249 domain-containing protein [Elusimicrobia bacterium]|nr:DUF2249 domain-containing protein [Elusimicrobiota bacterium]
MQDEVLMDVREMIPRERHPKIFAAWDALPLGAAIRLVNDHDPKPLYYQFQAERGGEFKWEVIESGPERWVALIRRVAAAAERAAADDQERPAWASGKGALVDVREDLRAGREPLKRILGEASKVPESGVLIVRATFEPRPLFHVLANQGFETWSERLAEDDWQLHCRKKRSPRSCGCGGHSHTEPDAQNAQFPASPAAGRILTLDVSSLEPPEPMVRILEKIRDLQGGDVLEVRHHREPVPLYAELEAAGFSHEIERLGENQFRLRIRRK